MPAAFPHRYTARLRWTSGREAELGAAEQPPILGGPPPQFDGSPRHWSPEELLLSSAQLCLMTTFLALCEREKFAIQAYESRIEALLEKTTQGLRFTRITLYPRVQSGDPEKAAELLKKAKGFCIVSNALNVPIELGQAAGSQA